MTPTPGPWTFQGTFEPTGDKMTYQVIGGAMKADAILMAAAPSLLSALNEIVNTPLNVDGYNSLQAVRLRFAAIQTVARAAIAKAEGRT